MERTLDTIWQELQQIQNESDALRERQGVLRSEMLALVKDWAVNGTLLSDHTWEVYKYEDYTLVARPTATYADVRSKTGQCSVEVADGIIFELLDVPYLIMSGSSNDGRIAFIKRLGLAVDGTFLAEKIARRESKVESLEQELLAMRELLAVCEER
jgi:hypothetical protein